MGDQSLEWTAVDEAPRAGAPVALRQRVLATMGEHWTAPGYTVPHPTTYPFQWLWDSCFHAVVWAELGDERAVVELTSVFRHQAPSGFVPHMTYDGAPLHDARFWGRPVTSSITQPPMYGHAVAELNRRGFDVPERVVLQAAAGITFLLRHRRRVGGLVPVLHPWETGTDDSPRWDDWCPGPWSPARWRRRKGALVGTLRHGRDGSPVENPAFTVGSAGFNALVAFNARELAEVTGDIEMGAAADELAAALAGRWDGALETFVDAGASAAGSGRIRTADALLAHLVVPRSLPPGLFSVDGYATSFGPAGVHTAEPAYDPGAYWRGSTWPQIVYLLGVAAHRAGDLAMAASLRRSLVTGAVRSGLAEHWHAETGGPLGAVPQSWTGLAIVRPTSTAPGCDSGPRSNTTGSAGTTQTEDRWRSSATTRF